mmetsp:Transcript_16047/g.34697  ORF Transcript_16047/g.34697 Transcript_16047/m.34697 type:complete len:350 (+) Transcript_16047:105-1154(+)|eukprot:CAMPEP_0202890738 /NCGR_PEP_ID=MMETSP1392-20130828/1046_1 /ASSEMBLY_ACC=CAM_ASM_000868 /TAXON_ID=225041 /ORGANISM="Chlamydomonas chlamydogama, Strain SAG 11-48b" /LENGTH=349 /DNA_ID=CAMNT_0049574361 /DNA_START=105 /DNA_END=1154 /DNA_ORIENTATION=+
MATAPGNGSSVPPTSYLGDTLPSPPSDGISALKFSSESELLVASSWDKTVRVYNASDKVYKGSISHQTPVLDVCLQDDRAAYSGSLSGHLNRLSLDTLTSVTLGSHGAAIRCVEYLPTRGLVATGSWDQTARLWDPRAPPQQSCVQAINLPGKVYTMSASRDNLVVGTSERHVLIFDLRKLAAAPGAYPPPADQLRESSLKYQTRCLSCYPDGRGYALGSVEGRVAMEYFDLNPEMQQRKYAFKCHRRTENGKDIVYPVHCIVFHPGYGTFATGGGDGVINLWDGDNKKRLFQISKYPTSVAAMAFNRDGSLLAVASSYAHERGDIEHEPDAIYIRSIQDAEVRPKQKK